MMSGSSAEIAHSVESSRPLQLLTRVGIAVTGLLHVVIGAIAISIATGAGGGEADHSGALHQLASTPGGVFVLWTIVVGLAALGLWQIAQTFLVPGRDRKRRWAHRVVELGKAVAYFVVAGIAFTFARGDSVSTAKVTRNASATLLSTPGGVILLVVGGLIVLVIGGFFVFRGATLKFTADISVPAGAVGLATVLLGVVGYIAKGIALAIAGILFVVAAFTYDTSNASGLDGALKTILTLPYGVVILIVVGAGLIAYGLYCVARALLVRL